MNVLTRKIGPLPGWAWGLIAAGGAGIYIWRKRSAAAAAATAATTAASTTGTGTAPAAATSGGYTASNYGPPSGQVGGGGGGGGLASILAAIGALQPAPATTPGSSSNPGVAAGESVLGSGYGVANAAFPTQGVLSVPTAQGTYTELNSSGNPAYGGTPATSTNAPGVYYQPTPGVFSPTQGVTLNPGTPIFGLTAPAPAAA